MTREEAINVIKGARQYLTVGNPIWNVKKVDEAMNMAIEALQAPSADSVSTEYAIECIDQCRERKNREIVIIRERKNREIAELKKQLADRPTKQKGKSADVIIIDESRPTGEWITCGTETGALGVSYAEKKCSHCGWAHSLLIPSNYCPNCGAQMVKEGE